MENVTFIEVEQNGVMTQHAIIDRGNGEFTSMPKALYDEMINAPTAFPHQPQVAGQILATHRFPILARIHCAKRPNQNLQCHTKSEVADSGVQ